jgi:hypothetical protein
LLDQLFEERGGVQALDVVSRLALENFALVCAQHKMIEARLDSDGLFTQTGRRRSAFDMLKNISETLERLRSTLPPLPTRDTVSRLDQMPTSALALTQELLLRIAAGESLSEYEEGQLSVLRAASAGDVLLDANSSDASED